MKSFSRFSVWLIIVMSIAVSCKKPFPKQTQYIPKDATLVLGISPKNLQQKLDKSKFNIDSLLKSLNKNATDSAGNISWEDIKNSGIDLSSNIYAFVNQQGSVMTGQSVNTGMVAALKNAGSFEAFLKKQDSNTEIKKGANFSYAVLKEGFTAGWNDDILILSNVSATKSAASNEDAATQKQLTALFAQKEDESVASIDEFRNLSTEKADVLFWTNSSSSLASVPFIGMTKAADLFKDSYTAGLINFEEGKAVMNTNTYVGKDLKDILNKYSGSKLDLDLVEKYPYPVNGFALISFNPKIIAEIIQYIGFTPTVNQFFQQFNFTIDDLLKAFKGDFAFAFSDFGVTESTNEYNPRLKVKSPSAKLLFDARIGDKASYEKVVSALAEKGIMVKQGDQYLPKLMLDNPDGFAMQTDDKNVVVASDSSLLRLYKNGKGDANIPADIKDKVKGKSSALYVNIISILNALPKDTINTPYAIQIENARHTFKNLVVTGENFDGKKITGSVELRMMNDKENSFVSIVKYFSSMATSLQAVDLQRDRIDLDSTNPEKDIIAPPVEK